MIAERVLTSFLKRIANRFIALERMDVASLPVASPEKKYTLYAHIPFCEVLCPYCSFNRFIYKEDLAQAYFRNLRTEIEMVANLGYDFHSMYIGGGTPTIRLDELIKTIDLAKRLFSIQEVSCETNPNHLTPRFAELAEGRIQRLSVGVQSFDAGLLKQMLRYEKYGSGEEMLRRLQATAPLFPTLNIDLIFNLPSQTSEILRRDIEIIKSSGVNQVSYYPLMTAPSVERSLESTMGKPSHTREHEYYRLIVDELSSHFNLTSAWTFSLRKSSMIDEYIVNNDEYVGVGSGSFSYLDGNLYVNTFSLREYEQRITSGMSSVMAKRSYRLHEQMRYRFLMDLFGLRLDKQRFKRDFGISVERGLWTEMMFMQINGAFETNNREEITLTPKGRYLLVAMMREFFSNLNRVRDQARESLAPEERAMQVSVARPVPLG
jgi:coproporphyrinogen III oxidase-like Fe-S oxidoreductase